MSMVKRVKSVVRWQRLTIFVLWLTYGMYYLGRVNLAIALPIIERDFGWSTVTLGLVSSSFFWVYAFGQLINGSLGDRLSSRYFIFAGLLGTALMNLLFGFSSSLGIMMLIWGVNGVFQSTGWGPIVKTAARWVGAEQRHGVSAILGSSFVIGTLVSWILAGQIAQRSGRWEPIFWIPAGILFVQAWLWLILIRDRPEQRGLTVDKSLAEQVASHPSLQEYLRDTLVFLKQPHLVLLAITTLFQGMIKDGINLWMPILLMQTQHLQMGDAVTYSLLVPLLGFVGVFIAAWMNKILGGDERRTTMILFIVGAVLAVGVSLAFSQNSTLLLTLLIGLCSMVINGINLIVLTTIPMRFAAAGKSSTLAGFLDFASYVGSGIMTILTGIAVSVWNWPVVAVAWALLFILGALFMYSNKELARESTI